MTKSLVIAEKPSVAQDLANALGPFESCDNGSYYETSTCVISYVVGHLLELASPETYSSEWRRWSLKNLPMVPEAFEYVVRDKRATSRLKVLKKLAKRKDIDSIVNACDAGREGEHIFRTVLNELNCPKLSVKRLWLNSLTTKAIKQGFRELREGSKFKNLGDAASCRTEADWLIGMNATRALTSRLRSFAYTGAWSVGRVQTPTLAMCVERELEIQSHRSRDFWQIVGSFKVDNIVYPATYRPASPEESEHPTRLYQKEPVEALEKTLRSLKDAVATEKRLLKKESPPLPYDLTSLQKATGLTAKRTQDIAQTLYERHKLLSYPRTDSRYLPQDQRPLLENTLQMLGQHADFAPVIAEIKRVGVQNGPKIFNDKRLTDHHAIMPVGIPKPGQLSDQEKRVYRLAVNQFLAAFMEPAEWESVSRKTIVKGDNDYVFNCTGRVLVHAGWQMAMGKSVGHGSPLTKLPDPNGSPVLLEAIETTQEQTKPKGRLTDAGLLSRMENCGQAIEDAELSEAMRERGLGTPATRADTIERLISRGYLARMKRNLRATAKAIRLIEILQRSNALRLTSVELTGDMESKLRKVETGILARPSYMEEVVANTVELVNVLVSFDFDAIYAEDDLLGQLPTASEQNVKENAWGFEGVNTDSEPIFLWKDVSGHVLTPSEIRTLLLDEKLNYGPVTLFPRNNPASTGYQAMLQLRRLEDEAYKELKPSRNGRLPSRWNLDIKPLDESAAGGKAEDEDIVGPLLTTKEGVEYIETTRRYVDKKVLDDSTKSISELPKVICEREISPDEARVFFESGKTPVLAGFISKKGKPFRAQLFVKENGRYGFEFEDRSVQRQGKGAGANSGDGSSGQSEEKEIGVFMTTSDGVEVIETDTRYVDRGFLNGTQKPKALLPKTICERAISPEEAKQYLSNGQTDYLDGFISKRGRPFTAKLVLKKTGRHGFEFEDR
jgi:DNA topoisomerase-3